MSLFSRISGRGGGSNGSGSGSTNPTNKQVCKFYLEGRCRFGDSCHNYHPPRDQASTGQTGKQPLPYHLSAEGVKADLTYGDDRPTWPLSAYGPGRDAPRQLLEGELEQSPEELRVLYYLAKAGGSTQQYEQNEASAVEQANQRIQQILSDVDGAINYIVQGKDQHPNRDDQTQKNAVAFNWTEKPSNTQTLSQTGSSTTFNQPAAPAIGSASAFGQPSSFGSGTTLSGSAPGGGSTFGVGQSGSTSAFGRTPSLGSGSTAFGQPSAVGGGTTAFGRPSAPGAGRAFGSQSTPNSSPFGQTSTAAGISTFGQSSTTTGGTTFGHSSLPGSGTAFGQPSAPAFGKPSPFGAAAPSITPAFGNTTPFGAQPSTTTSAFGQPSQPGQQPPAFGQPTPSTAHQSAFGQPSQAGTQQSAFGKPSPFGSAAGSTSTFGQPALSGSAPFGASAASSTFGRQSSPAQQQSPFGGQPTALSSSGANGSTGAFVSQRPTSSGLPFARAASRPAGQPLTSFKGQAVTYEDRLPFYRKPSTGKQERIWFPDGPPGANVDVEASAGTYDALGVALKQVYDFVRDNGAFKDGVVPEVPPKREWVSWDL